MWRGDRCVPREIFVHASNGNDANDGSRQGPFKTFKQAMSVAVEGQTVNFEPGAYETKRGDDFTVLIPHGVTLRTRPDTAGIASFVADHAQSLTFAGSGNLERIDLIDFFSPATASEGTQHLKQVNISGAIGTVTLDEDARLSCEDCRIEAAHPLLREVVFVLGTLTLRRTLVLTRELGMCSGAETTLISVLGWGNVVLDDVHLTGSFYAGVLLSTQGSASITSTSISKGCQGYSLLYDWRFPGPSPLRVNVESSEFAGGLVGSGSIEQLRVRRSTFGGEVRIQGVHSGVYDFGQPTSSDTIGSNSFARLNVTGDGVTFFVSGNAWKPNVQDAGWRGEYPEGQLWTVLPDERITGENIEAYAWAGGQPLYLQF